MIEGHVLLQCFKHELLIFPLCLFYLQHLNGTILHSIKSLGLPKRVKTQSFRTQDKVCQPVIRSFITIPLIEFFIHFQSLLLPTFNSFSCKCNINTINQKPVRRMYVLTLSKYKIYSWYIARIVFLFFVILRHSCRPYMSKRSA